MSPFTLRLGLGLMLLGAAGPAAAQQAEPPNLHFLIDTSGSMRELPQVRNSAHSTFFSETYNGCSNAKLDAMQASRGWNPATVYPVPDVGTGLGTDLGYPQLFQDDKFYAYMTWGESNSPAYQWATKEQACQERVPNWSSTGATTYNQCLSCLSTKGYWKLPSAVGNDSYPNQSYDFILWGRFLNFNPPKYVTTRAVIKSVIKNLQNARLGMSFFTMTGALTQMLTPQNAACSASLNDPTAFSSNRASYVTAVNTLQYSTSTPLAKSLLNIGYYFTSDDSVYRTAFGFGSNYPYPSGFKNAPLTSESRSVCWNCQTNAVVIITDGDPSMDGFSGAYANIATQLRTLNGGPVYCPDSMPCSSGASLFDRDKGSDSISPADDNPNYYLDDVAKLLYGQDLQRNSPAVVGTFDTYGIQRLRTYTVGLGIDSNLLRNTATVGGGLYFTADTVPSLQQALQSVISDVQAHAAGCIYTPPPAP